MGLRNQINHWCVNGGWSNGYVIQQTFYKRLTVPTSLVKRCKMEVTHKVKPTLFRHITTYFQSLLGKNIKTELHLVVQRMSLKQITSFSWFFCSEFTPNSFFHSRLRPQVNRESGTDYLSLK
jgi:hypothetical protein